MLIAVLKSDKVPFLIHSAALNQLLSSIEHKAQSALDSQARSLSLLHIINLIYNSISNYLYYYYNVM